MNGIDITVNEDGSINLRTTGFQGSSCVDETLRMLVKLKKEAGVEIDLSQKVEYEAEYFQLVKGGAKVGV